MRLHNQVAIVTGVSHAGQVGYALAAAFAREGALLRDLVSGQVTSLVSDVGRWDEPLYALSSLILELPGSRKKWSRADFWKAKTTSQLKTMRRPEYLPFSLTNDVTYPLTRSPPHDQRSQC